MDARMSKGLLTGTRTCPKCNTHFDGRHLGQPRVRCHVCCSRGNVFEFCWYCLNDWKTAGTSACGNDECPGEDPCLKLLRNCPEKVIEYNEVNCPSIRACPSCSLLLEHTGGCKTMTCFGCNQIFCFICLSKAGSSGHLPCGDHAVICRVVRQ